MRASYLPSLFALLSTAAAQDFATPSWIDLTTEVQGRYWFTDSPTPHLMKFNDGNDFSPRLQLRLDVRPSDQWYLHATVRYDDGFDADDQPDGAVRLDQVFARWSPGGTGKVNLQVGKFATVFGNHIPNHEFQDNPFLTDPLPYSEINGVAVRNPAGNTPTAIANRAPGRIFTTPKINWAAQIWGPAYTSGASIFGQVDKLQYAFEVKNVETGAHSPQWDPSFSDFEDPSFAGRIAWQHDASLTFGLSFARGPYLNPEVNTVDRGDFQHTMVGLDARYALGAWILSGEIIHSIYDIPGSDDLASFNYYLQARYKAAPGLWLAARFGQTINNNIATPSGEEVEWSPDLWRAEGAVGYRITPDLLLKGQYTFTHTSGRFIGPGEQALGMGVGWRF